MYIKRICWTAVIAIALLAVMVNVHSFVERGYSVANRKAAIATVNGGEAEFANVQSVKSAGKLIDGLFYLSYVGIIAVGGTKIYRTAIKMKQEKENLESQENNV